MPNKDCLSDMNKLMGMVADEADGTALINLANPSQVADQGSSKTYACSVLDCTYECAFAFLADGCMFFSAEAGVCVQALEIMASRRSADS